MNDRAALLEVIRERPYEDEPRLAFAEILERENRPITNLRAEFIRIQCRLARLLPPDSRIPRLLERLREIFPPCWMEWFAPLCGPPAKLPPPPPAGFFSRLAELFSGTETPKLQWEADLTTDQPHTGWVRRVISLGNVPVGLNAFGFERGFVSWITINAGAQCFVGVEGPLNEEPIYELTYRLNDRDAETALNELGYWPSLRRFTSLSLADQNIGMRGTAMLLATPYIDRLTSLNLSDNRLQDDAVLALASLPSLANLTRLTLHRNAIGPGGAEALVASPYLAALQRLELAGNQLGDTGMRAIAHLPGLARFAELMLGNNRIGNYGVIELARSGNLSGLLTLGLQNNQIGDEAVIALAESPALKNLRTLNLSDNRLFGECAEKLVSSPHLKNLRSISLLGNPIAGPARASLKMRFGAGLLIDD